MPDSVQTGASTAAILNEEARAALAAQAAAAPESAAWLALLDTALAAADEAPWRETDVRFAVMRPAAAPVLEGGRIGVDAGAAVHLLSVLLRRTGQPDAGVDGAFALTLLRAAVAQDNAALARLAASRNVPVPRFTTIAHFSAMPLLLHAQRAAAHLLPADWRYGYCPVCGAWPTLAEMRGLERRRVLRCGRCAAAWLGTVLRCTWCGEGDHRQQDALMPAEGGEFVRIETCSACGGYLKVITTLRDRPAWALALDDLRTLPLELVAMERGYRRPGAPGWQLDVIVSPSTAGP